MIKIMVLVLLNNRLAPLMIKIMVLKACVAKLWKSKNKIGF